MIEHEIWKEFIDKRYDENNTRCAKWEVSNFGRVKKNGVLHQNKPRNGYFEFKHGILVHRAVAELFIPNPDNKPIVDHIDTNPLNNRADNLRWVTVGENNRNPLTRIHNSNSKKGKKQSPETYKKIGDKNRGKKRSEETRKRQSVARLNYLKDHDVWIKGKHPVRTPEAIENSRQGLLKYYESHESKRKGQTNEGAREWLIKYHKECGHPCQGTHRVYHDDGTWHMSK